MIILGLNAYHGDASACLVRDGALIAAAEEERFLRIKHWAGFPAESIRYCMSEAKVGLSDVDVVAVNSDPKANVWRRLRYVLARRPDPRMVANRLRNHAKRLSIADELERSFPGQSFRGATRRVEHHLAHLASAFYVCPFQEAAAVSVDGFGDFASAAWGFGRGERVVVDNRVLFPHSLGVFYQALTQFLGFPHYGDEYKAMGMAPYGAPAFLKEMREIVQLAPNGAFSLNLGYFRHHRENIAYEWNGGSPSVGALYSERLEDLLGPARGADDPLEQRHKDIARSAQAMYEEAFFHLLDFAHARYGVDTLALAGGCAMNSVANGKIRRRSRFKQTYIQAAAGDAGGAIGAALEAWRLANGANSKQGPAAGKPIFGQAKSPATNRFAMDHAYWGPAADAQEIEDLLARRKGLLDAARCAVRRVESEEELCRSVAAAIADGQVVGWFQGRMEWGPRALGNRSIVCDPRRADMKDILNLKIKRRESFRPFAPSIQRERVADWFEEDDDVPFMTHVFQIREEKRATIPAVTHVDGSGRLQTVRRQANPRYWLLIEQFRMLTDVPIVLNTSFNENEPVVCRPDEALDCFLRTQMDLLALGDTLIRRL